MAMSLAKRIGAALWPPLTDGDVLGAARRRLVTAIALTIAVLGSASGLSSFGVVYPGNPMEALSGAFGPIVFLAAPIALALTGRTASVSALLMAALYALVMVQALGMGGAANQTIFYLAGIPVLTAFLMGYRSGLAAAGLVILTIIALISFDSVLPPSPYGADQFDVALWNGVRAVVLTLAMTLSTALFQREMEHANRRLEAASRAKSQFIANVSHEIRTPMNGVMGMVELLRAADLPKDQARQVEVLSDSGRLLLNLLNDVLDMSRAEAGKLKLESLRFNLPELIDNMASLHAPDATAKGVSLSVELDEEARGDFIGDPTRISQILSNLLSNAVKFTSKGEIRLRVESDGAMPDNSARLRLIVADSGIGIPPERAEALFRPFTQADDATSRNYGGTGLGLTICRQLCELMNGDISVSSRLDEGSVFTASIKLEHAPALPAAPKKESATKPTAPAATAKPPIRVLLVDDNATNRLVAEAFLKDDHIDVTSVDSGAAAISTWLAGEFDVILMDIRMPGMNGDEAARIIRREERESGRARTPIFAVTANAEKELADDYMSLGMDGVLAKPVSKPGLRACLERAVEIRDNTGAQRRSA